MSSNQYRAILPKSDAHPVASGASTGATTAALRANSSPSGSRSNTPSSARRSKRQIASQIEADAAMASALAAGTEATPSSTQRRSKRIEAAANKSGGPTSTTPPPNRHQRREMSMPERDIQDDEDPFEDSPDDLIALGQNTHAASLMRTKQGHQAGSALTDMSLASSAAQPRWMSRQGADWTREPPKDILVRSKDRSAPELRVADHATKAYPTTKGPRSPTTKKYDEITARKRFEESTPVTHSGAAAGGSGPYPHEEDIYRPRPIRPTHTPVQPGDIREGLYQSNCLEQEEEVLYDADEEAAIKNGFSAAASRAKQADVAKILDAKPGQLKYQEQLVMAEGAMVLLNMSKSNSGSPRGAVAPQQSAAPRFIDRLVAAARQRQQENKTAPVRPPSQKQEKKLSQEDRAQLQALAASIETALGTALGAAEDEEESEGNAKKGKEKGRS